MERTARAVTRSLHFRILALAACLVPVAPHALSGAPQGERATFILIERPSTLLLYNQYEQRLSADEKSRLAAFAPMRIIESKGLLSDGFTPCMKVEMEGTVFFIQTDGRGKPVTTSSAGRIRLYKNVAVLDDVIRLHSPKGTAFSLPNNKRSTLVRGTVLNRYFADGSQVYVRPVDGSSYGWIQLDPGSKYSLWSEVMPASSGPGLPRRVIAKIESRLAEVNRDLRTLYALFNTESGRGLPVPEWRIKTANDSLICSLVRDSSEGAFAASTHLLAKDFEAFLIGTDLTMVVLPRRIEIRRR